MMLQSMTTKPLPGPGMRLPQVRVLPQLPQPRLPKVLLTQESHIAKLTSDTAQCHAARKSFGPDSADESEWPFNPLMSGSLTPEQRKLVFQEFAKYFGVQTTNEYEDGSLPVDLEEQTYKYLLIANVPGLETNDLEVSVNLKERSIKIEGGRQRSVLEDTSKGQLKLQNGSQGPLPKFQRILKDLPEDAELSMFLTARVSRGVLTIEIPKNSLNADDTSIRITHKDDELEAENASMRRRNVS